MKKENGTPNFDELAEYILDKEAEVRSFTEPPMQNVLLRWRKNGYTGSIQIPYPNFSREIVFLSKTSKPVQEELYEAIRRHDPGRLELEADENLGLEGNYHFLRMLEKRLLRMTPEQTKYTLEHPLRGFGEIIPM